MHIVTDYREFRQLPRGEISQISGDGQKKKKKKRISLGGLFE